MSEIINQELKKWLLDEEQSESFVDLSERLERDYPEEMKKQLAVSSEASRERLRKVFVSLLSLKKLEYGLFGDTCTT